MMRHDSDRLSVYVAYLEGHPVACAWTVFHPGSQFASLWGGSTLAGYRGRGCYTALLASRAQEAQARGVRFLTVDASPMSRPILEKYHFQFLGVFDALQMAARIFLINDCKTDRRSHTASAGFLYLNLFCLSQGLGAC